MVDVNICVINSKNYVNRKEIVRHLTIPDILQQNDVTERMHYTLLSAWNGYVNDGVANTLIKFWEMQF